MYSTKRFFWWLTLCGFFGMWKPKPVVNVRKNGCVRIVFAVPFGVHMKKIEKMIKRASMFSIPQHQGSLYFELSSMGRFTWVLAPESAFSLLQTLKSDPAFIGRSCQALCLLTDRAGAKEILSDSFLQKHVVDHTDLTEIAQSMLDQVEYREAEETAEQLCAADFNKKGMGIGECRNCGEDDEIDLETLQCNNCGHCHADHYYDVPTMTKNILKKGKTKPIPLKRTAKSKPSPKGLFAEVG